MTAQFDSMISHLEKIHALPPGGIEKLHRITRIESLGRGEFFLRAGDLPSKVGFMTEGWLRYFHTDAEGRDYIRYFCNGDNFVSSQSALIEGEPSEFSIQAIEDSTLAVFEYADWLALLESHPAWGIIHKAILDRALISAERRERSLILDDAEKRYLAFLDEYPGVEDHVKQYDIASYLGISPVSLSRIRSGKEHRQKLT
jgi:CRP-like cAMP-binding protein